MKEIPLTQGYFAMIDDEDFERVMQYKWCITKSIHTQYAIRGISKNGRNTSQRLHRFILGKVPIGQEVDHINGNGLDNRKSNLRIVTHQQNAFNRGRLAKGVYWDKCNKKWCAQITINKKGKRLGRFVNLQDAIKAREKAAYKYFGEFDARKEERVGILYG